MVNGTRRPSLGRGVRCLTISSIYLHPTMGNVSILSIYTLHPRSYRLTASHVCFSTADRSYRVDNISSRKNCQETPIVALLIVRNGLPSPKVLGNHSNSRDNPVRATPAPGFLEYATKRGFGSLCLAGAQLHARLQHGARHSYKSAVLPPS